MGLLSVAGDVLVGALLWKALNTAYEQKVHHFGQMYKNSKQKCKSKPTKEARIKCMRQVLSKYYTMRAELEKEMVRELVKGKAPDKKVKVHKQRHLYFKTLAKVVQDPAVPLYKAPDEAKRRLGIFRLS